MKKSLYDAANNRLTTLKNTGYDYEGKIFEISQINHRQGHGFQLGLVLFGEPLRFRGFQFDRCAMPHSIAYPCIPVSHSI
jgi:hypothetical protein